MATSGNHWPANPSNGRGITLSSTIMATSTLPAMSRSAEWWSCIRTAVKIAQSTATSTATSDPQQLQQQPWWVGWNPAAQLPAANSLEYSEVWQLQEDGLSLLRGMQAELQKLQSLVRRRGHTNDPTQDIAHSVRQLECDAQELAALIQQQQQQHSSHRHSAQYQRHVSLVAQWLQQAAAHQAAQLKEVLQVRANVLQEQAQQRRKLLKTAPPTTSKNGEHHTSAQSMVSPRSGNSLNNTSNNNATAAAAAFQSPLFTATPLKTSQKRRNRLAASASSLSTSSQPATQLHTNGNSSMEGATIPVAHSAPSSTSPYGQTASYSYYNNGNGNSNSFGTGGGGYGGGNSMGIRQRKAAAAAAAYRSQDDSNHVPTQEDFVVQEQIQERQKQRQTQFRVEAARQAERTLSELSTLFGKMSMLITQQSETLEKVEDDVESAVLDVSAGQAELQILHHIKKGNRSLILKVFGLLIFFIIFMKLYAPKRR